MVGKHHPQEAYDVAFDALADVERTLDAVVKCLADAGVEIEGEERLVVSRWLDDIGGNQRLPMSCRVSFLEGWLRATRERGSCQRL